MRADGSDHRHHSLPVLIRTHPRLDYEALEARIRARLTEAKGLGVPSPPNAAAWPLRVLSRMVKTRLIRERLASYPRVYRGLRRLYRGIRSLLSARA